MKRIILPEKSEILGVGVHPLSLTETVKVIAGWIRSRHLWDTTTGAFVSKRTGATRQVVTLNVEMLYRAQHDPALRSLINQADLVVPDGHGVVWAGRRLGYRIPERVTGIDLIQALAACAGRQEWRVFLLGAAPGVAKAAALNLQRDYPGLRLVGTEHGYFADVEIVTVIRKIRDARPDLLLVALGSPKQEFFSWVHRQELGATVAIGVGGSFDVLSGRLRRAPALFQRLRLEWLYRVFQEPGRWRRLLVLPRFAGRVLLTKPGRHDSH